MTQTNTTAAPTATSTRSIGWQLSKAASTAQSKIAYLEAFATAVCAAAAAGDTTNVVALRELGERYVEAGRTMTHGWLLKPLNDEFRNLITMASATTRIRMREFADAAYYYGGCLIED